MRCIATFSLVLYSAPFSDTQDRLPWRTSRIRRVPGVPQLAPVYPGTPARASTRTQLTLPAGLGPAAICGRLPRNQAGEARMGRCAGDESDDGVGVRIQRAVLSRAYSTGSSAYRAGGATARSRAVARGRAGAHARGGDRGMYAPRVAPSGVCARSNRMHGCVRFTTFIQRLGLIARSARSGGTGRRLSGRAVHCAPTARAGLAGNAALGDPHERAGDAERAHAGKRSSPHAPFITMAIGKRAL